MNQSDKLQLTDNELVLIELLCEQHFNVAIVGQRVYTYTSVEPSSMTTGISIDFTSMRAVDITNFVMQNRIDGGQSAIINNFKRYIEKRTYLLYKFNKTVDYTLISLTS